MSIFVSKMELVDKIANNIDNDKARDIIKSLSFILWSTRKNYHYNETYLSDFSEEYFNFLIMYQKKKDFLINVINEFIEDYNDPFLELKIIFDNVWLFTLGANETNLQFYPDGNVNQILNRKAYIYLYLEYMEEDRMEQYFEIDLNVESIRLFVIKMKDLIEVIKER